MDQDMKNYRELNLFLFKLISWDITVPGSDEIYLWRRGISTKLGNIFLHHIRKPDHDRELHDHPWWFRTFILKGWYTEQRPNTRWSVDWANQQRMIFTNKYAGQTSFLDAETPHRIAQVSPNGVWTLVITGPEYRDWGFWTKAGWLPWWIFLEKEEQTQTVEK